MKKIFLILLFCFNNSYFSQDFHTKLFVTYFPIVYENRIIMSSTEMNAYGISFVKENVFASSFNTGVEFKYGVKKLNTFMPEPLEDIFDANRPFLESDRTLSFALVSIPIMYKIYQEPYMQINAGIKVGVSYFCLNDVVTSYVRPPNYKYSRTFSINDYDWNITPSIEFNSKIQDSFYLFLGVEHNFKTTRFQLISEEELQNSKSYDFLISAVNDLGNKIEYDYRGINLSIGLLYNF